MGQKYNEISDNLKQFILDQKIFFVGTATKDSRVNISPKGMDPLRVLDKNRVVWLNLTGSGNETAAHIDENPRMTIMFASFSGGPMILRLYGTAKSIHKNDSDWNSIYSLFDPLPGARQIFDLNIDLVHISCGRGVPFFDYVGERDQLNNWAKKKGYSGIKEYWKDQNQVSLDGKPTNILEKNT
ncbi:pyridoxamine 5'-phosphate oxidase family protein [Thermodesulfobacteriota bacterium]